MSSTAEGKLLDLTGGGLFLLLAIFPFLFAVVFALLYSLGLFGYFSDGFTLGHYAQVISGGEIMPAFVLSTYVAGAATVLTVGIGMVVGIYMGRDLKSGPLSILIYIPLVLPSAVAGFFVWLLLSGSGLVSRLAFALGLTSGPGDFPALVNDPYAIGIILAHVGIGAPFFAILFAQIIEKERVIWMANLARALGASPVQAISKVVVPILLLRARAQIVLSFIFIFGSFEIPSILGTHAPEMISVQAVRKSGMLDLSQRPESYVIASIYSLVVIAAILLLLKRRNGSLRQQEGTS